MRYFRDEFLLALEGLLQLYFVFRHNSSFAEYYFDFRRLNLRKGSQKLVKVLMLVLDVAAPYLTQKLDKMYQQAKQQRGKKLPINRLQLLVLKTYPTLYTALALLNWYQNISYLLSPKQ